MEAAFIPMMEPTLELIFIWLIRLSREIQPEAMIWVSTYEAIVSVMVIISSVEKKITPDCPQLQG